jgi:hypothetical protein
MATYDWTGTDVIPNGSGSAVRADLNDTFLALFSQNSSATAPPETVAYMPWADTASGLYKIRNGANSGWITLYQLDGEWTTIALENGTAAAPSLYFKDSGTDTGLYSPGTDQVAIATAGVQRVNFNGSTEVVFNDGGADVDFRIEGDTKPNLFKVDAGTDAVSVDGDFSVTGNLSGTIRQGTAVASTSGTSIDFTGIPSWVKRVTVMFDGVSTSGSSPYLVLVGNSGGIITTGYVSGDWGVTTAVASSVSNSATGFRFGGVGVGSVQQGMLSLNLISTSSWAAQGSFYDNNPTVRISYVTGRVTGVSPALDRIRITTVNGTDTFDAGSINILYEG